MPDYAALTDLMIMSVLWSEREAALALSGRASSRPKKSLERYQSATHAMAKRSYPSTAARNSLMSIRSSSRWATWIEPGPNK